MGICNIKHPLRGEPGSSQLKRANNALQATAVSIDGRSLADILDYLYRYSRQVNFQNYFQNEEVGEYVLSSDWSAFFEKSIPFLLARISKINTEIIGQEYLQLRRDFDRMPSTATFNQLMDYCYEEAIQPIYTWFETLKKEERYQREAAGVLQDVADSEFRFKRRLSDLVSAELNEPLKEFITIYQKANTHQVVTQRNFFPFLNQQIWGLKLNDLVKSLDPFTFNREDLIKTLNENVFSKFHNILQQISQFAPDYIPESLHPLQEAFRKQHEPHLALLFTFLELFKYVQGDMNRLSEKHLDFFFMQVLRVKPKPHRPDHAHLVFEMAKQLEQYLIKEDTLFKDGKDANKADLLYSLDDEIVIDKAAIERLMTLYLKQSRVNAKPQKLVLIKDKDGNESMECIPATVVALEGVYMAPVANSANGLGLKFPENQIPNWATLGAKESKTNAPGKTTPGQHPYARLGLILASPVLLLNEGRREVVITVCCDFNGNESIAEACLFFDKLDTALKQPYYKLTEIVLQKISSAFPSSSVDLVRKWKGASNLSLQDTDVSAFINTPAVFTDLEKQFLNCYLLNGFNQWKKLPNPTNQPFGASKEWELILARLENPLSDAARAYLTGLLASQNPYIFGYDLEACLDVKEEPSCKPLFSECEKKLLASFLEREERGLCYLDCCNFNEIKKLDELFKEEEKKIIPRLKKHFPALFPELGADEKKCLPVYLDMEELKKLKNRDTLVFNPLEIDRIAQHLICANIFKVSLSGKKGWHFPKRVKTEIVLNFKHLPVPKDCQPNICSDAYSGNCGDVQFKITIALDEAEPPIVCFDQEILKEDYDLDKSLPVAKIELNNELKLSFKDQECKCCDIPEAETCCLAQGDESLGDKISLYHFFRDLQVIDSKIDVKVCGIKKNIIVQNDENILDVNSPFQPFGVRPVIVDSDIKDACPDELDPARIDPILLILKDKLNCATNFDDFIQNVAYNFSVIEKQTLECYVKPLFIKWKLEDCASEDPTTLFFKSAYWDCVVQRMKNPGAPAIMANGCPCPPAIPKVNLSGPCFYLGSSEIFRKCWKDLCIHLNWKDKPGNIEDYYEAYDPDLKKEDFEVHVAVLEGGNWNGEEPKTQPEAKVCCPDAPFNPSANNQYIKRKNPCTLHFNRELFKDTGDGCKCKCPKDLPPYPSPFPYEQTIKIESRYFSLDKEIEKDVCKPLGPYQADTKDGFIKLCLENQDFYHDEYAYILSRQMIALSRYPEIIPDAVYVGKKPGENAKAINIKDLLKWVCEAKAKADLVFNNGFDHDLIALQALLNGLGGIGGKASITNNDIQQLEFFVNAVGNELANLNPTSNPTLMDDFIVFFNFWGDNPTMPTDFFGNIIFDPINLGLKGWFERVKDHFRDDADSVLNRINQLINLVGNTADILDLKLPVIVNSLFAFFNDLHTFLIEKCAIVDAFGDVKIPIPNEPWTPTIKNISLDYSACATKEDIELIHLYPFEGTYKHEDLEALPTLLPVFKEEGTLYLGLSSLRPGSTLNLLLQLAEATADSERDRALVNWHYLANNQWIPLRPGFEITSDETKGLTVSGIVKIAVPRGISRTGNTVMPTDLFWIKASVSEEDESVQCKINDQSLAPINKVKAVSETIAVHTQAARVTFKPGSANDLLRLNSALPASSITKMAEPEAGVKKMEQPYPSFNGKAPEAGGSFYNRVSEQLRHKGRAIAGFDYETLVLEAFQQIFKVKCINHDFGLSAGDYKLDLELAPGFVTLAVIPDLTKLTAGQGLEPRAPVSVLEEIKAFLKKRVSPFVRLKVLNPRYEKVNIKVHVRLRKGKDKAYYGAKLKEDLTFFFAPWFISKDSHKLVFGQPVSESEVIKFVEKLDYVDFITCLALSTAEAPKEILKVVEPRTARSILTAGDICVFVNDEDCDAFSTTPSTCININPKGETRAYPFHSVCEKKEELICPPIVIGS